MDAVKLLKQRKHQWQPIDTEGYCLECAACGRYISAWEPPDKNGGREYDREVDAPCPGAGISQSAKGDISR